MARANKIQRTKGVGLVTVYAFVLFAMPKLNISLGPVPVYFIDVMGALIIYSVLRQNPDTALPVRHPFRSIISLITVIALLSEVMGFLYGASILNSVYFSMRYLIIGMVFFAIPQILRTKNDIEPVLKAIALSLLVTGLLMISSSLPGTRGIALFIFSIPFLEPAANSTGYLLTFMQEGIRGRSLVGVSIISATYASISWPLVACLRTKMFKLNAAWTLIASAALLLAPMAVAVAYSRQALVGGVLILLATMFLNLGELRRRIIVPVLLTACVVAVVGAGSSLFLFDRYVNRFEATLSNPFEDERETARLLSYVQPFEHVVSNPQYALLGEGLSGIRRFNSEHSAVVGNHSLVGSGYFTRGLMGVFLILFLLVSATFYANWHRKRSLDGPSQNYPRALFLAMLPFWPFAAFAPGLGSEPRAMLVLIFILALLATLRNLQFEQATNHAVEAPQPAEDLPPATATAKA